MFNVASIWKKAAKGLVTSGLVTLALLTAQSAHAAGETYTWADTTSAKIVVGGAGGTVSGTLTPDTTPNTYSGTVAFSCSGASKTTALRLSLASSATPTAPMSGSVSVPADAACGTFDSGATVNPAAANAPPASGTTGSPTGAAPAAGTPTTANTCDNGSFTWVTCPFIDNVTGTISKIAKGALVPLLEVKAITPTSTPQLYAVWQHMRDLSEIMFILIFIFLIVAITMQQDLPFFDQYTIKNTLPNLVVAAILVQFSFLIVGLMVDVGNVLGEGITSLMTITTGATPGGGDLGTVIENLVGDAILSIGALGAFLGIASWTAVAPLVASLFISILLVFLTLGLRFLAIAILITLGPLAMVAWVLPNTRHWFTDWFKILFRLILMYPIVVGVISLAGMVNQILPSGNAVTASGAGTLAASLIKPLIIIGAFLIIPATFKLAGRGLNRAYDIMNGHAKNGRSKLQGSDFWKNGQAERQKRKNTFMGRYMDGKTVSKLQGSRTGRAISTAGALGMSSFLIGAPASRMALNESNSRLTSSAKKQLDDMDEATVPNLNKVLASYTSADPNRRRELRRELQQSAPNLLNFTSTEAGMTAVVKKLADIGAVNPSTLDQFYNAPTNRNPLSVSHNPARLYSRLLNETGKEGGPKPFLVKRMQATDSNYTLKDPSGNPVKDASGNDIKFTREMGSIELNEVGKDVRKITAMSFADKHGADNFLIQSRRDSTNPRHVREAQDAAFTYATNLDVNVIRQAFDPTTRAFSTTPLENRIEWAKGVSKNADIYKQYRPEILKATAANLRTDEDFADNLARLAGVSEFALAGLDAARKANIGTDFIYGKKYDSTHDYHDRLDPITRAVIPGSGRLTVHPPKAPAPVGKPSWM